MKNHWIKTLAATVAISLFALVAIAEQDRATQFEQRLVETQSRLNLTDKQREQIRPTLEQSVASSRKVLQKYGVDPENPGKSKRLGFKDARNMNRELEAVRQDTLKKLGAVLTDEQVAEYQQIQQERKAAMRQRMRQGRNGDRG